MSLMQVPLPCLPLLELQPLTRGLFCCAVAMCNGKAKLVCIDCETEGVPSGAVASLSIQSDAAPQCLADWQMSLSSSQESARGQVTLVSALASLSQEYIVIVKNAGHASPHSGG